MSNQTTTTPDQQAVTHRLYCGHKAEGTPGKIPHRNVRGLYCYDCASWVATMPSTSPPFQQEPQEPPLEAAKHTPGPWTAMLSSGDESWMVAAAMPIARITNYDDRAAANARLIAAAPDLLAALEAIVEAGRMSYQTRAVYCSLIAEHALISAKGGAQ